MCREKYTETIKTMVPYSPSFQSEEAVKEWVQSVVVGGNSLIRSLEYSQVAELYNKHLFCKHFMSNR